ncbi:Oidioi.mRNA.OKI2018_I69.chr2.g6019.t1.cds [Oikopleura dioica]|uniref:tRNA-intron lyase n=1 Tax=Oikopleura dioica TaxID=34765 RepID=A0ABN7T6J7_OIKDI|nr:Oidioi.mRNA.OKI2018_I69.chr2.g6019.t1.cds [Oikopleura dioica]
MKINIHVDLIGPCPRLLVSEKTGLPGLLTPYQASILLPSPNVENEYVTIPLTEQLVDFEDKFYLQLERHVKKSHLEIAASYGQKVDIPAALEILTEVKPSDRRWRVNFLDHGSLLKNTNDGSKCSRLPEIKGLDAVKDKCHRYLWECGYYLTSGMKYGCDWLAYEHPPDLVHAEFIVSVLDVDNKLRSSEKGWTSLKGIKKNL